LVRLRAVHLKLIYRASIGWPTCGPPLSVCACSRSSGPSQAGSGRDFTLRFYLHPAELQQVFLCHALWEIPPFFWHLDPYFWTFSCRVSILPLRLCHSSSVTFLKIVRRRPLPATCLYLRKDPSLIQFRHSSSS